MKVTIEDDELDALADRLAKLLSERAPLRPDLEYVDRRGSGLGPSEWRNVTREIDCFRVGRRLLVRRADLHAWIERHKVERPQPSSDVEEMDAFDRAIAEGRLRKLTPEEIAKARASRRLRK